MQVVERAIQQFYKNLATRCVWVGFSGGLDSTVLLAALAAFRPSQIPVKAIHIHHGLQAVADDWVIHCQKICQELNIELVVKYVQLAQGSSIEAQARIARYEAFGSLMSGNDVLCLAHHQRDQAETFLLNLMRGAGLDGLSAMPSKRPLDFNQSTSEAVAPWLYRPLLSVPYQALQHYAEQHQLSWVEDPTNQDTQFRRNFIRYKCLPLLEEMWSKPEQKIEQSVAHLTEAKILLQDLASQDLQTIEHSTNRLNFKELQKLNHLRQKNALRYWGANFLQRHFDQATMDWFFNDCFKARADASPSRKLAQGELRRYRNFVYYVVELKEFKAIPITRPGDWRKARIDLIETQQEGLNASFLNHQIVVRPLSADDSLNRRALKTWFQTQGIPPWQRSQWPVVEIDGELAAVVGFKVFEKFQAEPQQKAFKFVALN